MCVEYYEAFEAYSHLCRFVLLKYFFIFVPLGAVIFPSVLGEPITRFHAIFFFHNVFTFLRVAPSSVRLEEFRMEACCGTLVYCVFLAKHRAVRLPVCSSRVRYMPIIRSHGKSCARERKSSTGNARCGMRWWHGVV